MRYVSWHLSGAKSGSVTSLNDGTLTRAPASGEASTSYSYPNPGWMMGVVGMGSSNQPDPARRVLTFNSQRGLHVRDFAEQGFADRR